MSSVCIPGCQRFVSNFVSQLLQKTFFILCDPVHGVWVAVLPTPAVRSEKGISLRSERHSRSCNQIFWIFSCPRLHLTRYVATNRHKLNPNYFWFDYKMSFRFVGVQNSISINRKQLDWKVHSIEVLKWCYTFLSLTWAQSYSRLKCLWFRSWNLSSDSFTIDW